VMDELIKGMIYQINCFQVGDCWKHANEFPHGAHENAHTHEHANACNLFMYSSCNYVSDRCYIYEHTHRGGVQC
jgi:hypothetical protein